MKLTQAEKKWFERLQKTLDAAPESLKKKGKAQKISSYTIGDSDVTVFDEEKLNAWKNEQSFRLGYEADVGQMVGNADAELYNLVFPFSVESTAGFKEQNTKVVHEYPFETVEIYSDSNYISIDTLIEKSTNEVIEVGVTYLPEEGNEDKLSFRFTVFENNIDILLGDTVSGLRGHTSGSVAEVEISLLIELNKLKMNELRVLPNLFKQKVKGKSRKELADKLEDEVLILINDLQAFFTNHSGSGIQDNFSNLNLIEKGES